MGTVVTNAPFTVGQYLQAATASQITEAVSNGIWGEILRGYFRFGDYFIVPENHSATGSTRPDLIAYRYHPTATAMDGLKAGQDNVCFCVEGKGKTGATGFCSTDNYNQIKGYISGSRRSSDHHRKFGMLVAGDMFLVLATESNGSNLQYVSWANNDLRLVSTQNTLQASAVMYLSQHAGQLDSILRKIATLY